MVDYRSPALQVPRRKPVPGGHAGLQFQSETPETPSPQPEPQQKQQQPQQQEQPSKPAPQPSKPTPQPSEQRLPPRTSSASYAQNSMQQQQQQQQPTKQQPMNGAPSQAQHSQQQHRPNANMPSRNPSTATSSTTSTGGNGVPGRHPSNAYSDVRRSSSSASANMQSGYVASMRRQRATVWSDRAQTEDPRVLAQRRAAKQRAMQELQGGASGKSGTLLSTGKIRHNTSGRTMNYNTGTMVGAAVPMRLSANEVGDADDDLEPQRPVTAPNRGSTGLGTGSERGSTGSARLSSAGSGGGGGHQRPSQPPPMPPLPAQPQTRLSSGSSSTHTVPKEEITEKRPDIPEIVETPVDLNGDEEPWHHDHTYHDQTPTTTSSSSANTVGKLRLHNADEQDHIIATGSDVSEQEDSFGHATELAGPTGATVTHQKKMTDDLRRRGSVDDRSSSMTGVKLFVANPDLSD